jgi:ribosomal protein L30E
MTTGAPDKTALLRLLGLARRAGKLAVGADAVQRLVAKGRSPLVIVASDVGEGQAARYARLEPVRAIWADRVDREDLSRAFGRGDLAVVALDDPGFLGGLGLDTKSESRRARRSRNADGIERPDDHRQTDRVKRGGR